MSLPRCLALLLLLVVASSPAAHAAAGNPRELAAAHYRRGIDLAKQGLYGEALEQFNQAYAKSPHFAVLYNIGQAQIALGRPLAAIGALTTYLRDGADKVPLSRREQVQAQIALLEASLAELTISRTRRTSRSASTSATSGGRRSSSRSASPPGRTRSRRRSRAAPRSPAS